MNFLKWSTDRGGRLGHQLSAWASAYWLSKKYGLVYVHTPFVGNSEIWEEFFGFGEGVMLEPPQGCQWVAISRGMDLDILGSKTEFPTCFVLQKDLCVEDVFNVQPFFRELYFKRSREDALSGVPLKIAVHIRRGDVNPIRYPDRFIPNEVYYRILEELKLEGAECHLFSEGEPQDFGVFRDKFGCRLHLNGDPRQAFRALVMADVLVGSKSGFSYFAGMLGRSLKIFPRFWQPFPVSGFWPSSGQTLGDKWLVVGPPV